MMKFSDIPNFCGGKLLQLVKDEAVEFLLTDSRKIFSSDRSLFFCISGIRHDGHEYLEKVYASGLRQFIVEKEVDLKAFKDANFFLAESSVDTLQQIAILHRKQFAIPVVGITGSNGKTIVKEWLYQLLSPDYHCVKNPGSYNSQVGVPLSIWQLNDNHDFGVFEAGISLPNEMNKLQEIIKPTIGLITNVGSAHDEGFTSEAEKVKEKILLFKSTEVIIYCSDYESVQNAILNEFEGDPLLLAWGFRKSSNILLRVINEHKIRFSGILGDHEFTLPFKDHASRENLIHCIIVLLHLGYTDGKIQTMVNHIHPIRMRLEIKPGINQCQIVDDTYNNDLVGFQISLEFLDGLNKQNRTVILSDILQSGLSQKEICQRVIELLVEKKVRRFFAVGMGFHQTKNLFQTQSFESHFYLTTEDLLRQVDLSAFRDELILVKGGRVFQFERIVQRFQKGMHGTVLAIDLERMIHNFNFYKSLLKPGVKVMVMVKALAYGSGNEVAGLLQYHNADYLGVAYTDEGVELRKNRVKIPIMVMNPMDDGFQSLVDFDLEPEIYSIGLLKSLVGFSKGRTLKIHLKMDTGMNRLGLKEEDLEEVIEILKVNQNLHIISVFSHLAGSDDRKHDEFSHAQFDRFMKNTDRIDRNLDIKPFRHILNSAGILRFPTFQLDMVRLGIGLYGIDPSGELQARLRPAVTLKTTISQIKVILEGDSIGYGRKGRAKGKMRIATIAIGYADGFSRSFSRGRGSVLIKDQIASVVGHVCMDMTMVDITHIEEAAEGDEVTVFGDRMPIQEVAASIKTIPYEILTSTGERVRRVFYSGSV